MGWEVITGAAGVVCLVLTEGRWHYGSGTSVKQSPRLPPVSAARPSHHRPPSGSWQWARQPGNLPLRRWWQPVSVAQPSRNRKGYCIIMYSTCCIIETWQMTDVYYLPSLQQIEPFQPPVGPPASFQQPLWIPSQRLNVSVKRKMKIIKLKM